MSTADTGGAAFPTLESSYYHDRECETRYSSAAGMTLRDYFAAKALTGMLAMEANPRFGSTAEPFMGQDDAVVWIAKASYQLADAMLEERAKTGSQS